MNKVFLNQNWKLSNEKIGEIAARVPGCVHTDLLAEKIISDIYYRDNSKNVQWIENEDWEYSCVFDAQTGQKAYLVFEGLDTYAEIFLNGIKLDTVSDMFIPYKYDITEILEDQGNKLVVAFKSPIKAVEDMPVRTGAFTTERINTRRVQCTYGWDWVDRFVTCGITKDVYIEYGDDMCVENTYIYTDSIDDFGAQICVEMNFSNYQGGSNVDTQILDPDKNVVAAYSCYSREKSVYHRFDISHPQLWYPNGYGEQPLYTLVIKCGANIHEETFGIRTLKIAQLIDDKESENYKKAIRIKQGSIGKVWDKNEEFSGFQVVVNGKAVFCNGANWVPCEPFHSEESDDKIYTLVSMAKDMGINILRVWGGGLFEKKSFYDACDKLGILVVQDFLMACGTYPEKEEWFIQSLNREAAFAAYYLRNHPCLAWWQGDNENAVWGHDAMKDFVGRDSALKGIAPFVCKIDPKRVFVTSSPYGGVPYLSITSGTTHNTNYIGFLFKYFRESDCIDYKEYFSDFTARFINEDPIFGACEYSTLQRFMTKDDIFNDESEEMFRYHTKGNPSLSKDMYADISGFVMKVLGDFADSKDRLFKYKYIQYEWIRVTLENAKRNIGYSNGLIYWMFNDCWPAALGWSIIDYYCKPKAGYHAFKRCAKAVIGSVTEKENKYILNVSNKANFKASTKVVAYRIDIKTGLMTDSCTNECVVSAYSSTELALPWDVSEDALIVCDIQTGDATDRCFYKRGNLHLTPCHDSIKVIKENNSIKIKADRYVHAVDLNSDVVLADNYFSLLPGEERIIECASNQIVAYTL